jgi:hypothetical protein
VKSNGLQHRNKIMFYGESMLGKFSKKSQLTEELDDIGTQPEESPKKSLCRLPFQRGYVGTKLRKLPPY